MIFKECTIEHFKTYKTISIVEFVIKGKKLYALVVFIANSENCTRYYKKIFESYTRLYEILETYTRYFGVHDEEKKKSFRSIWGYFLNYID